MHIGTATLELNDSFVQHMKWNVTKLLTFSRNIHTLIMNSLSSNYKARVYARYIKSHEQMNN